VLLHVMLAMWVNFYFAMCYGGTFTISGIEVHLHPFLAIASWPFHYSYSSSYTWLLCCAASKPCVA
jgi:hypothetical protein